MKRLLNIILFLGLSVSIFSQYATGYKAELIEATEQINFRGDSLYEYIQDVAPSGTARDAGSGTSLDGNNLDWNGTLDKDVQILGAGNSVEIGTDVSKVNGFRVISSNEIDFESPLPMKFSAGLLWTLDEEYWYNDNYDTLGTKADIRELILASESVLPFNFDYTFNSSVVDSRPGIGYFKFNYQTLSSVTEIYIDYFDQNTISQNVFLSAADTGSYIAIQSSTNNYALYQLNDGYVDNGNYYTYKVDYIGHNGVISGSSVLDLNISNNTGGGSVSTGSDSTLTSSTNTITLSSGVLDGSGVNAEFSGIITKSVYNEEDISVISEDSLLISADLFFKLISGGNLNIATSGATDTVKIISFNNQYSFIEDQFLAEEETGRFKKLIATESIEADTFKLGLFNFYNTSSLDSTFVIDLEKDEGYADFDFYMGKTNGDKVIELQSGFSQITMRYDISDDLSLVYISADKIDINGASFKPDTITVDNISSNSQTLAGIELTGVSTSKEAIEGTEVDKFKTDTIILGTDTITSGSKEMSMYIFDASITIAVTQNEYSVITGWTEGYNQDDYFTVLNDSVQLVPGDYAIEYDLSFAGTSTDINLGRIYDDGVAITTGGGFKRGMSGTDSGVIRVNWKGTISSTSYISFRLTNTVNSNDPTISYGNISIRKIK